MDIHPAFQPIQPTRRGSALVLASVIIVILAGMAISLSNLTVSKYGEQQRRQDQVKLLAAVESAANESLSWIRNDPTWNSNDPNSGAIYTYLKNMPLTTVHAYPETTTSTSAVLVSSSLPSALVYSLYTVNPAWTTVFPNLAGNGNTVGKRNGCAVETKIIKVAGGVPATWDGTERFIIYTTATAGDPARPTTIRRERVEMVAKVTSVSSINYPFRRALFAQNGYNFSGNADTDSWKSDVNGDGIHETPYVAPLIYGAVGGINTSGDLGSNGSLGAGAYDTTMVHGTPYPNAAFTMPTVTYTPPAITVGAAVTNSVTYTGSGTTTTIRLAAINQGNRDTITIGGSGTVKIYVDGAFNVGDINFAVGSTAKLEIYQNSASGNGCSFNSQNTIGDPLDPSRFLFVTAFAGTGNNEMSLNGGASFSGTILAPYAGIKFNGNSDFYGSFIAKDFSGAVNGNFSFHYDLSLATVPYGVTVTRPSFSPNAYHSSVLTYGAR